MWKGPETRPLRKYYIKFTLFDKLDHIRTKKKIFTITKWPILSKWLNKLGTKKFIESGQCLVRW
jgi:hypothetical protein